MRQIGRWHDGLAAAQVGGQVEENKAASIANLIFGCSGHSRDESYRLARIYVGILRTEDPSAIRKGQKWLFAIIGN